MVSELDFSPTPCGESATMIAVPPPPIMAKTKTEQNETSFCSSEDPDVVIVVGGKEYREYRQTLRCWSGYFDAAFRSCMKESKTNRFEFPDKDPEEWELVVSLTSPFSTKKVTIDNVLIVLPWFDELDCARGLEECDNILSSTVVVTSILRGGRSKKSIDELLGLTATSWQCNLTATKAKCMDKIGIILTKSPQSFELVHLQYITSLMKAHFEFQKEVFALFQRYNCLPSSLTVDSESAVESSDDQEESLLLLLQQDLFPLLLHCQIQRQYQKRTDENTISRLNSTLNKEKREKRQCQEQTRLRQEIILSQGSKLHDLKEKLKDTESDLENLKQKWNNFRSNIHLLAHRGSTCELRKQLKVHLSKFSPCG